MRLALTLVAVVLVGAGVAVPRADSGTSPRSLAPEQVRATILVWGDGLFTRAAELQRWLSRHGESYAGWERTHPAGRAILAQAATPVIFRSSQFAPKGARTWSPPEVTAVESSPPVSAVVVDALVLALAGALLALGALPLRRVAPNLAVASVLERRRPALATAGGAIVLGLLVAHLFG